MVALKRSVKAKVEKRFGKGSFRPKLKPGQTPPQREKLDEELALEEAEADPSLVLDVLSKY